MIDLSPLAIILTMFGFLIVILVTGLPVVFTIGSIGAILALFMWGPGLLISLLATNAWAAMQFYALIALPMFLFMGLLLKGSGIIEELFRAVLLWYGGIPGGLAVTVIVVGIFIAAMEGIFTAGIVILGTTAMPLMLKYGYDKKLAIGSCMVGGVLSVLIPPSVSAIIYGSLALVPIGRVFIGCVIPGLILAGLYMASIGIRCYLNPKLGPPLPPEQRAGWGEKFVSLKGVILPVSLIIVVLGSIFTGIASPTEAAALGATGALVLAAFKRKLNWELLKESCIETGKVTGMVMWIFVSALVFKGAFVLAGGPEFFMTWIKGLAVPPLATVGAMQVIFLTLGCFVDTIVIQLICWPALLPIVDAIGFSRLWFGVVYLVNVQMAYLTPPFGFALFIMKGLAPEGVTMRDIILSIFYFVPLQMIALVLVIFFPQLALWLPGLMWT